MNNTTYYISTTQQLSKVLCAILNPHTLVLVGKSNAIITKCVTVCAGLKYVNTNLLFQDFKLEITSPAPM